MADRESERDRRVRELLSSDKSGNSGEQMAVLGQSQAEVQDIQSELQNHIALQRAQEDSRLRETQSITQAATGLMAMQQDDLQGQVATMNPQTQATMGKFGVKPQRSQNTTSNSSSNSSVSRSGNVTNIRNENVTHNTTNIKVTQPQIPVSQPQIPIQQVRRDDGTSKFKAWLSEMFAKQQNEAEIQRKEYRKKEWALGRTTTRLMKRIGEATANIGNKLDPQVMTSSLGGQLKWLLMIFGATMIAKVWKPTMKFLANLESGFRAVFGLPINQDLRNNTTGTLSIIEQIKSFIGIKKGENTSLIKGIGEVFMQGIDKLIDKLKFWFEDRAKAMRSVEFPKMESSVDFGLLGDVLGPAMEGITDTFRNVAAYLGDLITVAMGGTKGKMKVAARKMSRKAQESFTNTEGKEKSFGDSALINGNGRDYMRKSDYDMMGNLKGDAASTQAMSQSLISMINDRSNTGHAVEIAEGVSQLFKTAENNGGVVINPDILTYLGLTNKDLVTLKGNGMLKEKQYRIIFVKPSETQRIEHYGEKGDGWSTTLGIGGAVAGGFTGGLLWGAPVGFGIGTGIGDQIDEAIWRHGQENLYPKLVPAESNEMSADGSPGVPKVMWELTREGAKQVTHKLTMGMTNTDLDLTNREFYDRIIQLEERYKRRNGVGGNIIQGISDNELRQQQAAYDAHLREKYDRYESTDPNSYNMQHFYKANTFYNNVSNLVNQGVSYLSNSMRGVASNLKGESLLPEQQISRQNYLIKRLMEEGLTLEQAAGIAANIQRESSYSTNTPGDRGTSVGIAQWHNERITKYNTEYGAKGPLKDASFEEQVEYLIWEAKKLGAWDAVKTATTAEEAASVFERKFERSADYQRDRNALRMQYAAEAARSYRSNSSYNQAHLTTNYTSQNTSAEPQYQVTYFRGESPYEIVPQGGFKVSGSNIVAWIGDSHSQLGLPGVVGSKLVSKLNCEFIWGCKHGFTCNNHLKDDAYSNSSNQSEITKFSDILSKNPAIVIVELGDNDALSSNWQTGVDNLINKIKSIGAKVIWSTPIGYSTKHPEHVNRNAANNKFREYILSRSDIMSIDTGGFIGFYSNSPTVWDQYVSTDNIHWNKEGYKKLGEWIGGMLTGETVTNPGYNQADLETQERGGIFGTMAQLLGTSLERVADFLDPSKEEFILGNPIEGLTEEQRSSFNNWMAQKSVDEYLNIKSWERLGAKIGDRGLYFEQPGGVRVYVRTDGNHSGMFGLRPEDIDFIEAPGGSPDTFTGDISSEDWNLYAKSAVTNVNSFFVNYEDKMKGEGYNDYIVDAKGKPVGIELARVTDLEGFSKQAQKDFSMRADFIIYPTKDFRRWNIDALKEVIKYGGGYLVQNETLRNNIRDASVGEGELRKAIRSSLIYYGPIIRHVGKKWLLPGDTGELTEFSDYQPVCYYNNVRLTPTAEKYAREAVNFLYENRNKLKDLTESGKIRGNGTVDDGAHHFKFGSSDDALLFYGNRGISNQYEDKVFNGEIFDLKSYSDNLGIENTLKDREKFYKEHKNLFTEIRDESTGITDIIGPQGLKWGTIDKNGKLTLLDNNSLSKVSREDVENNLKRVEKHNTDVFVKENNLVSYEDMATYLSSTRLNSSEYDKANIGEHQISSLAITYNKDTKNLPIYISQNENGEYVYKIKSQDLRNTGWTLGPTSDISSNSLSGLREEINNWSSKQGKGNIPEYSWGADLDQDKYLEIYSKEFKYLVDNGSKIISYKKNTDYHRSLGNAVNTVVANTAGYTSFGIVSGSVLPGVGNVVGGISGAVAGAVKSAWDLGFTNEGKIPYSSVTFYLENGNNVTRGTTEKKDEGRFYELVDINSFINKINAAIENKRSAALPDDQKKDALFESSGLGARYKELAELVKGNKIQYRVLANGKVVNSLGQIIAMQDSGGNTRALTRDEAESSILGELDSSYNTRAAYYRAIFGDNLKNENGVYYLYSNDKNHRIRVDLTKSIQTFRTEGVKGITYSDNEFGKTHSIQSKTNYGGWTYATLLGGNGLTQDQITNTINNDINGKTASGLTSEVLDIYKQEMLDSLAAGRRQTTKLYDESRKQTGYQKEIQTIIQAIAAKQLDETRFKQLLSDLKNIENSTERDINIGKAFSNFRTYAESDNINFEDLEGGENNYNNVVLFDKDNISEAGKWVKMPIYYTGGKNAEEVHKVNGYARLNNDGSYSIYYNNGSGNVTYKVTNVRKATKIEDKYTMSGTSTQTQ